MELRDLQYFAVVAEHQNIGRAAEALELSATALSKSLRRLEKSLGAKVVQRAPKGVALTAVGAALLVRIGPLQGILNDVRHEATDLARGYAGYIHAGANQSAPENCLAQACVALSHETSRVTLKITVDADAALRNAMRRGEMDFCVSFPQAFSPDEFTHDYLYDNQDVVFASAKHRLAKRKVVSLAELSRERWASTNRTSRPQWRPLIQGFEKQGLAMPAIALATNSQAVRMQAIAYSDYIGLTTRQFLRQEARKFPNVELPIKEMTFDRAMSIIYRKGSYLSPAAKRLIDIIKTQARESSGSARKSR